MSKKCNHKNPLIRGGTSQPQRILKTLQKDYVQIDEHNYADLILFAKNFSQHIQYFNLNNQPSGSWEAFYSHDVSVLVSFVASHDISAFEVAFAELNQQVEQEIFDLGGTLNNLPANLPGFKKLFDFVFSLAALLDQQIGRLPNKTGLKAFAEANVQQYCNAPFIKLLGIYKTGVEGRDPAGNYKVIDENDTSPFPPLSDLPQKYARQIITEGLALQWVEGDTLLSVFGNLTASDFHYTFGTNAPAVPTQPVHVEQWLNPALKSITAIYHSLSKVFYKITFESLNYLEETLEAWPSHTPHMALYLSFLKLFRFAQNDLNDLKEDHVNFYYREILRLQERPAQPDEVFAIIELAKQVDQFLLEKNTAFKGGKDREGNELIYKSTTDTAINTASIVQLKAIYKHPKIEAIYTSAVVNSLDGFGEPLTSEDGGWKPFGSFTAFIDKDHVLRRPAPETEKGALFSKINQVAEVGFAIASPNLFLKGGSRTITISLAATRVGATAPVSWPLNRFKIQLTGEEGWIDKSPSEPIVYTSGKLIFKCKLEAEESKVIPYDATIHGETFRINAPIVKILLQGDEDYVYNDFKKFNISEIRTEVAVEKLKDILVQNEIGKLDLSSPVLPFGGTAKVGSSFMIGSKEVLQKDLIGNTEFNIEWDGLDDIDNIYLPNVTFKNRQVAPPTLSATAGNSGTTTNRDAAIKVTTPASAALESRAVSVEAVFEKATAYNSIVADENITVKCEALLKNGWVFKGSRNIIDKKLKNPEVLNLPNIGKPNLLNFDYSKDETFTPNSKDGFLRFTLKDSFGQKEYQRGYTEALIDLAKTTPAPASLPDPQFRTGLKDPPYVPSFKEISINYTAVSAFQLGQETTFENRAEQFFHLHPFGQRERHTVLNEGKSISLFPQFEDEGALLIGIKDLEPQQSISVLFQIAEGTAEPLKGKQPVEWYFLYKNNWKAFSAIQDANFNDQTNGLLHSGLISFFLPKKINTDNTWLETGHIWLKASVKKEVDAISNIIDIRAQAVRLRFESHENAESDLAASLAAGSIKKLLDPTASIKKIEQPYSSFGGKLKEQQSDFHTRISERLRHKNRAITIWDYEHLILEEFPEIYRVKCLNHTQLRTSEQMINEVAPGHVLLVTIPDLQNKTAVATLKPYTSLDTLDKIRTFIKKRVTPHAKVEVVNPLFEEIQLDFQVQFRENRDFTLHKEILNQDILKFLSPWAFKSENQKELAFGGEIYKSVLIDFIDELSYVDFVTEFKMNHLSPTKTHSDMEAAVASTPRSILVSVAQHNIKEIDNCI